MSGRQRLTPEQRAERELALAHAAGLGSTLKRIAFWHRMRPLIEESAASYRRLRELSTGRGERWSWTYHARKAERELLEIDATLAALEAWADEQQPPTESELRAQWGDR